MFQKEHKGFWVLLLTSIPFTGCIEEFTPKLSDFEDALVVEATITDELKLQTVYINRTYTFEDELPTAERNVQVEVQDSNGNSYTFQESEAGVYTSVNPFRAVSGTSYQLHISTQNGNSFSSSEMRLPIVSTMDDLYAERIVNDLGEEGMGIFVDNISTTGGFNNYRYEYVETYKVIAPDWNTVALRNVPQPVCPLTIKWPREREEQICYPTTSSNEIILASTGNFDENRIERFQVRFVNRDNYILSHRYSILVRQYVQSNEAFSFYETLRDFSGLESIFSETQPGFLEGNVRSDSNTGEKILGYFDVATVTERRLFFNYDDFFPGEALPPYADPCQRSAPKIAEGHGPEPRCILSTMVDLDLIRFVADNEEWEGPQSDGGPFHVVPRVCGDCTVLGTTEVPEFWSE